MRIMIFSDIHGNLPAFEQLLHHEEVDEYINLGDVVNYGPWSNECVQLVSELKKCYNIRGNHEDYFINKYCDVQNPIVLDFYNQCISDFKYTDIIKQYYVSLQLHNFKLVHTLGVKDYIFNDTEVDLTENTLVGHSHQQFIKKTNNFTLLNPGSVGQNRKYINVSNYVIWDLDKKSFELKQLKFDINIVINEMESQKYPLACIAYYKNKKILI
jgi:putative phosphoesterase